jgi:hypothetical protein
MVQWPGNRDTVCRTRDGTVVWSQRYEGPGMVHWSELAEICRIRDGTVVWQQRYEGPWMVQGSGNRDMQDHGWYSGRVTVICWTRDATLVW